jgi:outer membrane autotransporter protein
MLSQFFAPGRQFSGAAPANRPFRSALTAALLGSSVLAGFATPVLAQEPWFMVEKFTFDAESLGTRAQGITTDGTNWYFSGGGSLQIADGNFDPTKNNFSAIPQELRDPSPGAPKGLNHIGDIDYADGLLYIALDSDNDDPITGDNYNTPVIAIYNANDLSYTGKSFVLSPPHGTDDIASWVAVDVEKGVGYGMAYGDATEMIVYNLSDWSFKEYIPLSQTIDEAQGGKILDGWMYFATNDDTQGFYRASLATGEVEHLGNIESPFSRETEGLSFGDTPDGKSLFILNRERLEDDFSSHAYMGLYRHLRPTGNALSGEVHADIAGALMADARFMREATNRRLQSIFGTAGKTSSDSAVLWGQTFASKSSTDASGDAAGFDRTSTGFIGGMEGTLGDWLVGLSAGYSRSDFNVSERASTGTADTFQLGVYGGTSFGDVGLHLGASWAGSGIDTERSVMFPAIKEELSASYGASTVQAYGELDYRIEVGTTTFSPFAGLALVSRHTDAFEETGGDVAALSTDDSSSQNAFTTLGVRFSTPLNFGEMTGTLHGQVGWQHALRDVDTSMTLVTATSASFESAGVPIAKDALTLEAGLDFAVSDDATVTAAYSGQLAEASSSHGIKLGFDVKF